MQPLGKVVYTVRSFLDGHGEEFNRWQAAEHIPLLLKLPGYYGVSRFEQVDRPEAYMNVWEVESREAFESPKHDVVKTEWRTRVAAYRKEHSVDFYQPFDAQAVVPGQAQESTPSYLTRYDGPTSSLSDLRALGDELASHPDTCFVRSMTSLKDDGAVLLMHYATTQPDSVTAPADVKTTVYARF